MTFALQLTNITNAIAALSIPGVTIKDVDELAASWVSTPNVLYPNPNEPGFITDFDLQYDSILQGAESAMTVSYTLNYVFLGTQVGDLGTFTAAYGHVVTKLVAIIDAIVSLHAPYSGAIMLKLGNVSIGPKIDPVGNQYHGAEFSMLIQEMQN